MPKSLLYVLSRKTICIKIALLCSRVSVRDQNNKEISNLTFMSEFEFLIFMTKEVDRDRKQGKKFTRGETRSQSWTPCKLIPLVRSQINY